MRKCVVSIEETKKGVSALLGKRLKISVNKGRKKIERFSGEIAGVYPSVFVVKIEGDKVRSSITASYSDLICGDIKLKSLV